MSIENGRLKTILRYGYLLVVTLIFLWVLYSRGEDLLLALEQIGLMPIIYACLLAYVGVFISGFIWLSILRGLGAKDISFTTSLRLFFVTQLGKYIPGSLFPVLMQADLAKAHDISKRIVIGTQILFMWIVIVSAAIISIPIVIEKGLIPAFLGYIALVLFIFMLLPKWAIWVLNQLLLKIGKDTLVNTIPTKHFLAAVISALIMWIFYGLHIYVLIPHLNLITSTSSFALAWLIGFLVLIAPAGVGIREAVLAFSLPTIAPSYLVLVVIVSRFAMTLADGMCALGLQIVSKMRATNQH